MEAGGCRLEAGGWRLEARDWFFMVFHCFTLVFHCFSLFSSKNLQKPYVFMLFCSRSKYYIGFSWFSSKNIKKPCVFIFFFEASKCRISHYSATLSPFAILAPKCQFHEVFLRSKSIFDAPAQWGARQRSTETSPARTHSLSYRSKNPICQRHV